MKVLEGISDGLAKWLLAQPMFFVATAPLAEDGHVNLSLVEQRDILDLHQEKKGPEAYVDYGQQKNAVSIDGLPALDGL